MWVLGFPWDQGGWQSWQCRPSVKIRWATVVPCRQPSQDGSVPVHDSLWFFSFFYQVWFLQRQTSWHHHTGEAVDCLESTFTHIAHLTSCQIRDSYLPFTAEKSGLRRGKVIPKVVSNKSRLLALSTLFNSDCLLTITMKQTIKAWETLWTRWKIIVTVSIFSSNYLPWSDGTGYHDPSFLNVVF